MRAFDQTKWREKLIAAPMNYGELLDLAGKRATKETYADQENPSDLVNDAALVRWIDDYFLDVAEKKVSSALVIFSRQMIILAVTYVEAMMRECMQAFFDQHPKRMHDFLRAGSGNDETGAVPLSTIINSESREHILASLSDRAAAAALSGSIQSKIKNLVQVTKCSLSEKYSEALVTLVKQRNRLVHDASEEEVGREGVEAAFGLALALSRQLVEACVKEKVAHKATRRRLKRDPTRRARSRRPHS